MAKMGGLISKLEKNQPVFLDTVCFIYTFEKHSQLGPLTTQIFDALSTGSLTVVSSVITVSEILTKPFQAGRDDLIAEYKEIFAQLPNFSLARPSYDAAIRAAQIRGHHGFRLIDSLQLAVACEEKCRSFVSNDRQLGNFSGLKMIYLADFCV